MRARLPQMLADIEALVTCESASPDRRDRTAVAYDEEHGTNLVETRGRAGCLR
jgi:hypothetical protein